ncbi:MAG: hypothetical protein GWN71_11090, partial [Gammaproteobacteria bacterium]|nr:hypothetical protein [Gammaproteobacteria bacterium]
KGALVSALIVAAAFGWPQVANAYVGPGAGLSLVGALWALLLAIGALLVFAGLWPVKRLLRRTGRSRPSRAGGETVRVEDPRRIDRGADERRA